MYLIFSTTYHPQLDSQIERTDQILEDILHMYIMDHPMKWGNYLHSMEFIIETTTKHQLR